MFLSGPSFQCPSWWKAVLLFCFVWGFFKFLFFSYIKAGGYCFGKRVCLTPLCGTWQQETVSASGEADSISDIALVLKSLLDKWGFVWMLSIFIAVDLKEWCSGAGTLMHCSCGYRDHSLLWFSLWAHSSKSNWLFLQACCNAISFIIYCPLPSLVLFLFLQSHVV